ncbi:MAG: endopeptidase La [Bacteroidales bacterium]|jgi:ATP-dependent Lon protease|nr:endopeptidase La [Bacteroidales bacterium]
MKKREPLKIITAGDDEPAEEHNAVIMEIPVPAEPDDDNEQDDAAKSYILPIMPLRNSVMFPGVVIPISITREKSLKLVRDVFQKEKLIGTVTQIDDSIDDPQTKDLYRIGTVAQILKVLEMPDGNTSVIIQGKQRFMINRYAGRRPYFKAEISLLPEIACDDNNQEFQATIASMKDMAIKITQFINFPPDAAFAVRNIDNSTFLINFICSHYGLSVQEKQKLLETTSMAERASQLLAILVREVQMLELKRDIQSKAKIEIDQQQREYFLNQQMKTIQNELGGNPVDMEIANLKKEAEKKKWSKETAEYFEKEISKLSRLNPAAGEYSIQYGYCQTLLELPWGECTEDNFDLKHASEILDAEHFGLEKVKERILEHLAVLKLKKDMKAPILCLYGPPGVGKTSLGKSIANALGRKYFRMSLGGLHDEAEIRGHRKTYIGAMPGRIILGLKKVKSSNPVFVLDEIDKVSSDFHGDPASALLEVLDPEQNAEFHDNYLDIDYDLSHVLFIATANTLNSIAAPLRDRLELIEVGGYIPEEKVEIAHRHLIPQQLEKHGLQPGTLSFDDDAINTVINDYTRESGVRELDQNIAKIIRRIARKIAANETYKSTITVGDVKDYLGTAKYFREDYQGNEFCGVVTGLAWTAQGGEILFIESSLSAGKGELSLTGNLGEVMKESAKLALEYLKSHAEQLSIAPDFMEKHNLHIHVPEGAIPKDGPSAGITMATSLASTLTHRKVRENLAMTGEITLRGKVLPVGGIKEKILAAKRAGIKEIILSEQNRKDVEEIKDVYLTGLTFRYVKDVAEVLEYALL